MGYSAESIEEASDGLEALQALEDPDCSVDIVLADWNMPTMDGIGLLRKMQASPKLRRIPVIMVTGEAQRDRVVEAISAGARSYVVKPFTSETLRQKVLSIEMELVGRKKPSDTAVFRFDMAKLSERPEAGLPFIAQLPEELVAGIYEAGTVVGYKPGDVIVNQGDVIDSLTVIDRGEVELQRSGGGAITDKNRGECIGEIAFLSGDGADMTARARTDVSVIAVDRPAFDALLAEYPHLSFYLTRLLAKRASQVQIDSTSSLSGRLDMMTLAELVQSLNQSQKTGTLRVANGADRGVITFSDGNVRSASLGGTNGEEAFYQLITWAEGGFEFEAGDVEAEPTIFRATMSLLMEGMRRQDEMRRMRG
jgi:two-component system chemotaxis response regulator CheY